MTDRMDNSFGVFGSFHYQVDDLYNKYSFHGDLRFVYPKVQTEQAFGYGY